MAIRIIFLAIVLIFGRLGFSQTIEFNTDNKKSLGLNYGIELIESNNIYKADKFIREFIDTQNTVIDKVASYYRIAITYNNNLFYNLSLEYAFKGISYLDTNSYLLSELYQVVIINHIDLKNYDVAESYYWKTSKYHIKKKNIEANEYNLLGEIYRLQGRFKASIPLYQKAIRINTTHSFFESLTVNYNNIGLSYLYLNNIDSAIYFLNKSTHIIDSLQLLNRKSAINISFGELYLKMGEYTKALDFFKKTITFDLSSHPDKYEVYRDAYKGMASCYEYIGNYKRAFESYQKYQDFKSKILDYETNNSILQNQILSDRQFHFKEMNLIKSKLELEIKHKKLITLSLIATLFIIILIFYILVIKNKKAKQQVELEINKNRIQELKLDKIKLSQKQMESELIQNQQNQQIKELERTKLEEQVQSKNRELTSTAIHLMSKNELLNQIQEKITQINNNNDSDSRINTYKEIGFLISDSLRMDEDWQIFKKHFTDVHPLFFEKLKRNYSDLTTDELKLCAFLKIQLSSKEIARLINITVAAVNKRRNRLRKKLQMTANDDFYDFFLRIES